MPETAIAFARLCLCGVETAVAFAGAGRASTETGVAFAGAKCVFLVHFSGAEVMVVSMVAVQGRAVVMSVSKSPWAGSRARKIRPARPDVRASAKKFALLGLMVGVSAKKFALLAHNTSNSAFLRLPGEVFRGNAAGGPLLGEFFRDPAVVGARG